MVVHSIADGLAMGSSIFCKLHIPWINLLIVSEKSDRVEGLGVLIFLAIILHKIPASIGFGTFLYH